MIRRTLPAFALCASLAAGSASAAEPGLSATVRFADLNVSSSEGARILYSRIRGAAETLCGPRWSVWEAHLMWEWKECYDQAVDEAVARVNQPMLTDVHRHLAHARG
jgi:UrcA family protein